MTITGQIAFVRPPTLRMGSPGHARAPMPCRASEDALTHGLWPGSLSTVNQGATMKPGTRLQLTGRRTAALGLVALLSCFVAFGTSTAVASAATTKSTTAKSLTRAQKLSQALKACKKQPKRKRAACVRRATRQYGPHHAVTIPGRTPSGPATAPTAPGTSPTAPAPPLAGPVAPAGPTDAQIQQWVCEHHINCVIQNFQVLERGVPRLGTGVPQPVGDNVPSDTWIFPVLVRFDQPYEIPLLYGGAETGIQHTREKIKAQFDHSGAWALFFAGSSTTCEPAVASCPGELGGGA
jgi:hypothetical protein